MAFQWYRATLGRRPLLTQSVTSLILFSAGDVLAQQCVERRGFQDHDFKRSSRMGLYGGFIFGPAATLWYSRLAPRIVLGGRPAGSLTVLTRVAVDQLVFSPINLACFLTSMAYLEGSSPSRKLQGSFWKTLRVNWTVWPAVQLANFTVVPPEHRVLLVNVVALGWNCYLSYASAHVR
jgi:protein Mpv17